MPRQSDIDIADVEEPLRSALLECEVTGNRSVIRREGRAIAVLASWDEYLALRDTAILAGDENLAGQIRSAERELQGGEIVDEAGFAGSRIAVARSSGWDELSNDDRAAFASAAEALVEDPIAGAPLFPPFRGLWSVHRGGLRVIYRIAREAKGIGVVLANRVEDEG